jgi:hypothetical protein
MLDASIRSLQGDWDPSFGDREFSVDVFLSYNRDDSFTRRLVQALRRQGVQVWWDENGDVCDRRVIEQIQSALFFSRYVVVCIGPTFCDSSWTKAEYLSSFEYEHERRALVCSSPVQTRRRCATAAAIRAALRGE